MVEDKLQNSLFAVGQVVQAKWKQQAKWLPAQIKRINGDGTCRILYEDRRALESVPLKNIRSVADTSSADSDDVGTPSKAGATTVEPDAAPPAPPTLVDQANAAAQVFGQQYPGAESKTLGLEVPIERGGPDAECPALGGHLWRRWCPCFMPVGVLF